VHLQSMLALPLKMIRPFWRTAKSPVLKKPSASNFWAESSGACRYLSHTVSQNSTDIKAMLIWIPQEQRRRLD
jgi:hypothetical protein